MSRGGGQPVVASPLLVGAVTVLVTIVAVFLAYNANQGLPFVPTYQLKAELPSGSKLVEGNEARIGGFRVGQVTGLGVKTIRRDGRPLTIAEIELELDKQVQPLPADTIVAVRPRSFLGLKYVELVPGDSERTLPPGATIPLENARAASELEDVLSTFDAQVRISSRRALEGYGDALADRGFELNRTIRELAPLLAHLTPVMRALSDPGTGLDVLFRELATAAAAVAPVAHVQAELFTDMATTFEALSLNPDALRATIAESPETLAVAIDSLRVQRPFVRNFAALSRELLPAAEAIPATLPDLNDALEAGVPVLGDLPRLNRLAADVFRALDDLASEPVTLLALRDLDTLVDVTEPLLAYIAPYQLVCNYWLYFWGPIGTHQSEPVPNGTIQRIQVVMANPEQDNSVSSADADRPADVPAGEEPETASNAFGPLTRAAGQPYSPAVDAEGKADCQNGQTGYIDGPLAPLGRYPPDTRAGGFKGGGSHVVLHPDTPGRRGGTYVSRRLGIDGLEDVR